VKFNGKERLHDGKTFWDRQAPILFPTVGRLRDNKTVIEGKEYKIPQHGFAKDMDFELIEKTKNNTGLVLNIAFNYGGRDEIVRAVRKIAEDVKENKINVEDINEQTISNSLYTAGQLEPDLLIRTSGEQRLSNFLLWQLAYTEFYFVQKYWPDFSEQDLDEAISVFEKRNRKFGGK